MPLVVDAIREKSFACNQVVSQLGAVAFTDQTQTCAAGGLRFQLQGQNDGRLMQEDAARCYSHALMLRAHV